jgi:hypothetical protein
VRAVVLRGQCRERGQHGGGVVGSDLDIVQRLAIRLQRSTQ